MFTGTQSVEPFFGFNRWESVRSFVNGLGRLNLINLLNTARVKFYHHLAVSTRIIMVGYYFADHFKKDRCLNDLFLNRNTALHSY